MLDFIEHRLRLLEQDQTDWPLAQCLTRNLRADRAAGAGDEDGSHHVNDDNDEDEDDHQQDGDQATWCPSCQARNDEDARFCKKCGERLHGADAEEDERFTEAYASYAALSEVERAPLIGKASREAIDRIGQRARGVILAARELSGAEKGRQPATNLLDDERIWPSGYSYLYFERGADVKDALEGTSYYYPLATRNALLSLEFDL